MNIVIIFSILTILFAVFVLVLYFARESRKGLELRQHFHLTRHGANPVISPLPIREWELGGTFNPAAFKDDEGNVHLLYRAIGGDGLSRIGHASSRDGLNFDNRSMYPVYEPLPGYGMPDEVRVSGPKIYNPAFYTSGGGWGGSEDPRAVSIDGKRYMSYTAFEGWESVRIALTSIGMADVKKERWNWRRPTMISAPNTVAKNWVIFPEKINGKFAVLHSIVPKILIEYVDSLDIVTSYINSPRQHGPQPGRKDFWDNRLRGAGPPPIRTDRGWLLLYHANDMKENSKYKLGAMLLDLHDPTKILYR